MKEYKYVRCDNLSNYNGWDVVQIIPKIEKGCLNMVVISKENKTIQNYIKLNEANNEQLIEELNKRLKGSEQVMKTYKLFIRKYNIMLNDYIIEERIIKTKDIYHEIGYIYCTTIEDIKRISYFETKEVEE